MNIANKSIDISVNNQRFRQSYKSLGIKTDKEAERVRERIFIAMKRGEKIDVKNVSIFSGDITINELFQKTIALYWSHTDHGLRMQKMSRQIESLLGVNTLVKNINMDVLDDLIYKSPVPVSLMKE